MGIVMPASKRMSKGDRNQQLEVIANQVSVCPRCPELVANRTQPVFGIGPLDASIMFIGEAPGRDEDRGGRPFIGAAGRKLDQLLAAAGIDREAVYITNVIKCRPPKNRVPLTSEIVNCRSYLEQQIELVQPKSICALGAVAAQWLLQIGGSLGNLRGQVHEYGKIPVVCTYHPAYLLRAPDATEKVHADLQMLLEQVSPKS
jgi:uracil-DNA glycosylase